MMKMLKFSLTALVLILLALPAQAAKKVALLIGNSVYNVKALSLRNPANDVAAMGKKLTSLGFTVITAQDASIKDMKNAMVAFEKEMQGAEMGMFFFAGHGSQVSGENFMLGADFSEATSDGIKAASLTMSAVREAFARAAPEAGVVILDACRNNPLDIKYSEGERKAGLARAQGSTGLLIAYATDPGNVAYEGNGDNSIFTTALLRYLDEPGLDVRLMFGRVRQDVVLRTRGAQVPWVEESLLGEFSVNDTLNARGREAAVNRDIRQWRAISGKTTVVPYQEYLAEFPKGMFAEFARQRIARFSFAGATPTPLDTVQTAVFDVTKDTDKIAQALNILGFAPVTRSALDLDQLELAAASYRASLGKEAALTPDNLFADASRLLLYLGGSVGKQIQVDIAALSSIDQTLIIAYDAYEELKQVAGDDPAAKPILLQAIADIKAIERAQSEVLGKLDQEREYYEELMAQANEAFPEYMVARTIGGQATTRSFQARNTQQTDRAKLFLQHVQQEADAQTQGTYAWLSDFLPQG